MQADHNLNGLYLCKWKFTTDTAISEIEGDEIKSGKLEELESRYLTGASLGGIAVPVIYTFKWKNSTVESCNSKLGFVTIFFTNDRFLLLQDSMIFSFVIEKMA